MTHHTRALWMAVMMMCSAVVVPITFAGAGTAQAEFDIQYTQFSSGADGPSPFTEDFKVRPVGVSSFSFGPDTSRSIRIRRADTGAEVTLQPQAGESTYNINEIEINAGDLIEFTEAQRTPRIQLDAIDGTDAEMNVSIRGDLDIFRENAFDPYVIEILDADGDVLAATDQQIHGVRYEVSLEYNGTALAVTRAPSVREGWYVELQQDVDGDGADEKILEFDHDSSDEFFVANTAGTEFNESKHFEIEIYENESDSGGDRLATLFLLEITDENRVTGPVGESSDRSDDGGSTDPVAGYANDQGIVDSQGLLDAAADFRAGEIDSSVLLDVAAAFRSGTPVT